MGGENFGRTTDGEAKFSVDGYGKSISNHTEIELSETISGILKFDSGVFSVGGISLDDIEFNKNLEGLVDKFVNVKIETTLIYEDEQAKEADGDDFIGLSRKVIIV